MSGCYLCGTLNETCPFCKAEALERRCAAQANEMAELRKQLKQAEARFTRLVTASRNAIRMWALAQNWISEKMRPTYKEWDAAMEEFEQALALSPTVENGETKG